MDANPATAVARKLIETLRPNLDGSPPIDCKLGSLDSGTSSCTRSPLPEIFPSVVNSRSESEVVDGAPRAGLTTRTHRLNDTTLETP